MSKYCFGIDIGGTTVKCGLFDTEGNVLDKWEIKTRTEDNGKYIIPDVAAAIEGEIAKEGIDKADITGVGVGVPGPVDENGVVPTAVNLHWGRVELAADMTRILGITTKVGNDANVAALGEMWKGGGEGYKNLVMVTLGTGVGGGIILGEKILSGSHGAGGEIGHMPVEAPVDKPCNCGNTGCLEQVASATGIVYLANKKLEASDAPSVLRGNSVSAKSVFDAVKAGDPLACEVAEEFGKYLGTALASIAAVVDPQVIVIGGGVSKAGDVLLDVVKKHYMERAFSACRAAEFSLAKLGNDAGIFGAARMVLE